MRIKNDDYENKRIYEESLNPEGIRKTVRIKDDISAWDISNKRKPLINKASRKDCKHINNSKVQMEIISTITFLIFFVIFLFLLFI